MPKGYYPEALWNYTPVLKPMPPLSLSDVCGDNPVCVSFSESFVPYLLGLLEIYRWPDRFTGTEAEREYSAGLFRELMGVLAMACCCGDGTSSVTQVILHQVNPITLQLEISIDGGQTWVPDPQSPINQVTAQPPPVTSGISASTCDAATNGKQHIEDLIAGCHEYLTSAVTVFDLAVGVMTTLLELIVAYFSGLTLAAAAAALAGSIWGAAHAAFTMGVSAFDAYWTSDERDKILCAIVCHIGDDGAFTQEQYDAFLADWTNRATPSIAFNLVLSSVKAGGLVGMNNMLSYGESADADCGDCECGCDFSHWSIPYAGYANLIGTGVDEFGFSYVDLEAVLQPSEYGGYGVVWASDDDNTCCTVQSVETLSGSGASTFIHCLCGEALPAVNVGWPHSGLLPNTDTYVRGIGAASPNAFSIRITMG